MGHHQESAQKSLGIWTVQSSPKPEFVAAAGSVGIVVTVNTMVPRRLLVTVRHYPEATLAFKRIQPLLVTVMTQIFMLMQVLVLVLTLL